MKDGEKMYRDSDYNYSHPQCAQQTQNSQREDNYSSSLPYSFNSGSAPVAATNNTVYNQQSQGQPMYNIMYGGGGQGMYRTANSSTPVVGGQQMDSNAWILDPCLTAVTISDKDKQIKLPNAQLSPASCCSSMDPLTCSPLPDYYKTINKDLYSKAVLDSQWFHGTNYTSQKCSNEFPSCSQIMPNNDDCGLKFCSLQNDKIYGYSPNSISYTQQTKMYSSCQVSQTTDCSIYETINENSSCIVLSDHDTFYSQNHVICNENLPFEAIPSLELRPVDIGGESDIVVEDSEEDVEDSDDNDKEESHCIVCNTLNTPIGAQFFILTPESPLSMSSQKPVFKKLTDIIGQIKDQISYYLCSHCLSLVNTIDHLENNL